MERLQPVLTPGTRVSHYEILRELGRGGKGVVYLGRDLRLGRTVALKCVRPDYAWDPDSHKRLLWEARTASRLSHPNIVKILEVFQQSGVPWITMEAVPGLSLGQLLAQRGPLPLEQILRHSEEITDALRAAHATGVVHHDVSPNNILITAEGRAILTDFGLASVCVPSDRISEVSTQGLSFDQGGLVGTPGYMSPEQLLGKPADKRSDIFSLGAALYGMCAGRAAFSFANQGEMLDAVLNCEPVPLARLNNEIPGELERIICKAMAKRPDERYQDLDDMLVDIRTLRRRLQSAGGAKEDVSGLWSRTLRRRVQKVLGVAALLAAAGIQTWWWVSEALKARIPAYVPRQLTTGDTWEAEPAVSPDGTFVAYVSPGSEGNDDIWLIDARGGEPMPLTGDPASDHSPAWFPDGSALVFVSDRGGSESIWKTSRLGGAAVMIVSEARDPAISVDGRQIAFSRRNARGDPRIHVASVADPNHSRSLTGDRDGLWEHRNPAWSHDGRTLCYEDFRDLWLVPVSGGKARRLTSDHATDRDPVWSADDQFIYFSSLRGDTQALWRVRVSGGTPERLTLGTGPEGQPSLAGNGTRLGYSTFASKPEIIILDRRTGSKIRMGGLRPGTAPAFAPDLSGIIFGSDRNLQNDLWVQPLAGGSPVERPRRLTDLPGTIGTFSVSPDGRWIAYHRVLGRQRDIWIIPGQGGPAENFTDHPAVDIEPAWSPDGTRIAFVSDRGGHEQVWVAPVASGRPAGPAVRLTAGDAREELPAWSPDSRRIAFILYTSTEADVWIVPVDALAPPRRVTSGASATAVVWEPPGDALLVNGLWGSRERGVRRVPLLGGNPEPLRHKVTLSPILDIFSLSGDGRFLAYVETVTRGDIWFLETETGSN